MKHKAFSIIEVAMVICVISLAVAGIITAKNILSSSGVRGLASQIEKYDHSIAAFYDKYKALPGDLRDTQRLKLTTNNTDGDNNGIITSNMLDLSQANGEISNFWLHLSNSKMLDEIYDGAEDEFVRFGQTFPISKLGESAGIIVFGDKTKNFYQIGFKFTNIDRLYTGNRSVTPKYALAFDKKIDDGDPMRGRVTAAGGDQLNLPANMLCANNGQYNIEIKSMYCQLKIELKTKPEIEEEW